MDKKIFVLGIGAQKAGTTWLHKYLDSFHDIDTGCLKEYHIWDAVYTKECSGDKVPLRKLYKRKQFLRWRMQHFEMTYFDYFQGILNNGTTNLTADITPSYSSLKSDVFERIYNEFDSRDIGVKVIFIIRDPVERCWSAVRFYRRLGISPPDVLFDNGIDEEVSLLKYYGSPSSKIRTQYDVTISELETAVPRENIFYGVYENLFEESTVRSLSSFLGIDPNLDFVRNRYNVSDKNDELSTHTRELIAKEFEDVYRYCGERFPSTKNLWQGFEYL